MASQEELNTRNAGAIFRQILQQESGARISDASARFKSEVDLIIGNFSYSPLLPIFAPYSSGYGKVSQIIFYRSESGRSKSPFRVAPLFDIAKQEYCYVLMLDEGALWQIIDVDKKESEAVRDKLKKQTSAGQKIDPASLSQKEKEVLKVYDNTNPPVTTYDSCLEKLEKAYGCEQAYQKLTDAIRYVLLHEVMHVILAHSSRTERLMQKFGFSNFSDMDYQNLSEREKHLRNYLATSSNICSDAFINVGLDEMWKDCEPILIGRLQEEFREESRKPTEQEVRDNYAHMYAFNSEHLAGIKAKEVIDFIKTEAKGYPDLEEIAAEIVSKIEQKKMLAELVEEDVMEVVFAAAIRRDQENICPSCKKPMAGHGSDKASGAGDSSSDDGECPECGYGAKERTVTVTIETGDGTVTAEVTLSPEGDITRISPTAGDEKSAAKAVDKLSEMEVSVGRQLAEIEKSALEDLTDTERQKSRGMGSVFGRSLAKVIETDFPWMQLLEGFIARFPVEATRQSWAKPVIALKRVGWYYPDEDTSRNPNGFSVVMYVDASGSMSNEDVLKALGGVFGGSKAGIKNLYLVIHDWDLADMSKNQELVKIAAQCGADKKVLQNYGVIKLSMSDARAHKRRLAKFINEVAKTLPAGGTSHVTPTQTLINNGFFAKELNKSRLSGVVFYTDCYSDLEALPDVINPPCQKHGFKAGVPAVIVDSNKTGTYTHPVWPSVTVGGKINSKKKSATI